MWRLVLPALLCLAVAGCVETTGSIAEPHAGVGTCRQTGPAGKISENCNCPRLGFNGFCPPPALSGGEGGGY